MGLFRRRRPGRHELGGAVRDIPHASPVVVVHPPEPAPQAPRAVAAHRAEQTAPAPRVELGFRDGSTAALAPDSAQALALVALAGVLTKRD